MAVKGKDIGAKGKTFAKIEAKANKEYGNKTSGAKVAGAILRGLRAKAKK